MRLSKHSDYALRVLIYLAEQENQIVTTQEIARFHRISLNHLAKVVHHLSQAGIISIRKGRHGGIWLAKDSSQISIREVVELCEPDFQLAECFQGTKNDCLLFKSCRLKMLLHSAKEKFLDYLEEHSLESLAKKPSKLF